MTHYCRNLIVVFIFVFALANSGAVYSQSPVCEQIARQIEYYQQLRRSGGSGQQMDQWKRRIQELKEQAKQYGCRL